MKYLLCLVMMFLYASAVSGSEIGFDEAFSLARDRLEPLKQLIPGSEDYYYYYSLYHQNRGEFDKVQNILDQWIHRYGHTARVEEIRTRQALLTYPNSPNSSLQFIKQKLNLRFDHQKQQIKTAPDISTRLDQKLISAETLTARALSEYQDLNGFEDTGIEKIDRRHLDPTRRRNLLSRLVRPDYPDLVKLVIEDLRHERSGGFGSHPVHKALTIAQLDECMRLMPELIHQNAFFETMIRKNHPPETLDWENDRKEKKLYLIRLWKLMQMLPVAQNSLKAQVLYHRLDFERSLGTYDPKGFLEYLQLPKNSGYVNRKYIERESNRYHQANINSDYRSFTLLPPVSDDEPLVRDFLEHLLLDAHDYSQFSEYVDHDYLKEVFAKVKVLNGKGDMEKWYSMLSPTILQDLKNRVDIEFLLTNPKLITNDEPVALDVALKNVAKLLVRIYRINTVNFLKENQEEVTTAIDLDGLVANEEKVFTYSQPEMIRHIEKFEFPELSEAGIYVVEMIGNGKSSRAIIRRGRSAFTERCGAAGHVFSIYDEANEKVPDASIWLSGREFLPEKSGEITVPFSTRPGKTKFLIIRDNFACLREFDHLSEEYNLSAGVFIDREQLIEGRNAQLALSPRLSINGSQIDISLLEEPVLTIITTDREKTDSSMEIRDIKFNINKDYIHEFRVPEKLTQIRFELRGKIKNISKGTTEDLADSGSFSVNSTDMSDLTENFLLRCSDGIYYAELCGKTGEPRADRSVNVELKHRDFRRTVQLPLKTACDGVITLGELVDIDFVTLESPEGAKARLEIPANQRTYPSAIHLKHGEPLQIPVMQMPNKEIRNAISVLKMLRGTYIEDSTQNARYKNGFIIVDDLAEGEYEVFLKPERLPIKVRISGGKKTGNYLVNGDYFLQTKLFRPLQISNLTVGDKTVTIDFDNVSPSARVHVTASRFIPPTTPFGTLGRVIQPNLDVIIQNKSFSQYISGRTIGDEYRYILERKYAKVFPGNLLKRPSLLLNPWSLRKTDTQVDHAADGDKWSGAGVESKGGRFRSDSEKARSVAHCGPMASVNLDFLNSTSLLMANLVPDSNGRIQIDLSDLGARRYITIYASNLHDALQKTVALSAVTDAYKDIRMSRALDPKYHFAEQKNISIALPDSTFEMQDISTAKMEIYDSISAVYRLFATLSSDQTLAEFSFITGWPGLDISRKKELYSKYACHELSFFIYKKDPDFFKTVIKPYIANKRDKTFLDHWLLGSDLSEYLQPWQFHRLNVVERILLARRMPEHADNLKRHIKERFDLIPPDLDAFNRLFDTALKSTSLDTGDRLGFRDAKDKAAHLPSVPMPQSSARVCAPPPPPPKPAFLRKLSPGGAMKEKDMMLESKSDAFADSMDMPFDGEGATMALEEEAQEYMSDDLSRRKQAKAFYRAMDKTEEWVENNYYKLPIERQIGSLITVNAFWNDFAASDPQKPFVSKNLTEAASNFTEMIFALAVLDLPFEAPKHKTTFAETRFKLEPSSPVIVFHREIRPSTDPEKAQVILTSRNFFAKSDRYRYENNERFDKFLTREFIVGKVYGCQVAMTNPTSNRKKVDVLLQIPNGAIPVSDGFYTRNIHTQLEPYSTQTVEYFFYFPKPGQFEYYPVQVAENGKVIAAADSFTLKVVDEPTIIDKTSWQFVSQNSTDDEVLKFIENENVERLDLSLILFRLRNRVFYEKLQKLLESRFIYSDQVWSYSVYHGVPEVICEYLKHSPLSNNCGSSLISPLLALDPVKRHKYQHREYWPLVNARVYQLGSRRKILNSQFHRQYHDLLADLRYRSNLNEKDLMAVTYYLLLQDRIDEAAAFFDQVKSAEITSTIQYAYLHAWLSFSLEKPEIAAKIAGGYKDYPVDRWRNLFREILNQYEEIRGKSHSVTDSEDRDQLQTAMADTEPAIDFKVENRIIKLNCHNLEKCRINFYLMDLELLFSHNPFVQDVGGRFSTILPNASVEVDLRGSGKLDYDIPDNLRDSNVMIEVTGAGISRTAAYYPHSLSIRLAESFGHLTVTDESSGKALPKVYVKVYARMNNGEVSFYKDGYTDLRGRFDYVSLSTDELDRVERFAILIVSEKNGSLVRESAPPKM